MSALEVKRAPAALGARGLASIDGDGSFDDSWRRADTVVVGGGTSGPAVAGLLAEGGERVLVLEAGPDYGARDSGRWPADLLDARAMPISHAWGYDSGALYPERVIPFDRARVIGGCSSHNGCAALWGSRADYDGWDAAGLVDRRAAAALPRRVAADAGAPGRGRGARARTTAPCSRRSRPAASRASPT